MSWLVGNTLVALLLALLTLGVGRWLKPAPGVMHGLWLLVVLKLATPPLFTVEVDWPWATAPVPQVRTFDLTTSAPGDVGQAVAPLAAPRSDRVTTESTAPDWTSLALLVWAAGAVSLLLHYGWGALRAERRLRRLPPVPLALQREVAEHAARLGVAVPDLRDDARAPSPYVACLGRTRLVLPVATLAQASPKGRAAVLVHELAHVRRGDHLLVHAELLLTAALWWHPLLWLARAQLRDWAEIACDAWAVASVPEGAVDYASVLVDAVARPDPAVTAATVLAVRPAARAAFERRLTMILDQRVPCRASRAWLFSFAPAALTMFGAPVLAQGEGEREDVRIEIRVNGKSLDELGAIERRVLLQKLLGDDRRDAPRERVVEERVAKEDVREPKVYVVRKGDSLARIAKTELGSAERFEEILRLNPDLEPLRLRVGQKLRLPRDGGDAHDVFVEVHEDVLQDVTHEFQGLPGSLGVVLRDGRITGELRGALREVREELQGDADLRELGITDEVTALVDDLAAGKGLQGSLDNVIKAAMKGASRIAIREIEADEDLRDLGITAGVKALVTGLLENEHNQALIGDLARQAAKGALRKAKAEIEADVDLRDLRITGEVSGLVEGLFEGGDFDANLERLIEKVLRHVGEDEAKGRKAKDDEGRKGRSVIR